jgi:hypothetical protein
MALGPTRPVEEIITKNISGRRARPEGRRVTLTTSPPNFLFALLAIRIKYILSANVLG